MPLSEEEQRLLDEMERSLYSHDADFVSTAGAKRGRISYRNVAIGAIIVVVGIAALVIGAAISQPLIGVAGFVFMFGGVLFALTPSKTEAPAKASPEQLFQNSGRGTAQAPTGFLDKMNDRWDKREGGDR